MTDGKLYVGASDGRVWQVDVLSPGLYASSFESDYKLGAPLADPSLLPDPSGGGGLVLYASNQALLARFVPPWTGSCL
ncbi:MAG: hypothetical protein U0263_06565 [Polyangiaceae bacterium]